MGETDIKPDVELTARLDEEARKYVAEKQKPEKSFEHVALMTGMGRYIGNPVYHYKDLSKSGKTCFWGGNEHIVTDIPFDLLMQAYAFEGISDSKYTLESDLAKRRVLLTHSFDETNPGIYNMTQGDIERLCITAEMFIDDKEGITELKSSWQRLVERVLKKDVMTHLLQPGGRMTIPGPFFEVIRQTADAGNYFFFISNAYWPGNDYSNPENEFSIIHLPNK